MQKPQRVPIYSASAISNSTGEKLGFTIYETGERLFKISCGQRKPHLFRSLKEIDPAQVGREIAKAFDANGVSVKNFA